MPASPSATTVMLDEVAAAVQLHQEASAHGSNVAIADVCMDSRLVAPGSMYVAIRGARADGHTFVEGAVARGAAVVAVEEPPTVDTPYLLVEDTRQALGWIAAAVQRDPSRQLRVVGITGTNGKTTVAHMMAAMSEGSDRSTAVIGTVSANLDGVVVSPRTTPEASELQRILRHLADGARITDVAIEVSSHAMVMGRVNGTQFDVVAFTNLSQDHLDYHHTMEDYFAAKASLFDPRWAPRGIIWTDDPWGKRLADESPIPVMTVGTNPAADVHVTYLEDTPIGSRFDITLNGMAMSVRTALAGRFNVANAAIALACAQLQGWDLEHAIARLASMKPIPGRYNTLQTDRGFWVVVDYAHTPDAIALVIDETRSLARGGIIAVVGAGGDRDQEKRPLMGAAVARADIAVVTTDNPRSEDPMQIAEQVFAGASPSSNVTVELDRRLAIRHALSIATEGDVVLILGKGHETGQELADRTIHFDDREVVREELDRLPEASP